ncbi:hypothetical protein MMC13_002185 [Lambiella insularis]|nr:hypothetical protein [Lambiella insularis]
MYEYSAPLQGYIRYEDNPTSTSITPPPDDAYDYYVPQYRTPVTSPTSRNTSKRQHVRTTSYTTPRVAGWHSHRTAGFTPKTSDTSPQRFQYSYSCSYEQYQISQYQTPQINTPKRHCHRDSSSTFTSFKTSPPPKTGNDTGYYEYSSTYTTAAQLAKKQEASFSTASEFYKTTNHTGLRKDTKPVAVVPAGYSLKNWDLSEEPIILLGSVFDADSLGKWIYDWTVFHNGSEMPTKEPASSLWSLLLKLSYDEICCRATKARHSYGTKWKDSTSIVRRLHELMGKILRSGSLRLLSWVSLIKLSSALPVEPSEAANGSSGWPSGPGLPSISGWPSPVLGLVFAIVMTALSKPQSTSRLPGSMALVFNYVSLVVSADATTPPAVMWTLKGLATYFVVFYGDVVFRRYHMGQGYFGLLIVLGSFIDYFVVQILQVGPIGENLLADNLLRFSLPAFSLSLFLCAYHAYRMQYFAHQETEAWLRARAQLEEQTRRPITGNREHATQQSDSA